MYRIKFKRNDGEQTMEMESIEVAMLLNSLLRNKKDYNVHDFMDELFLKKSKSIKRNNVIYVFEVYT